MLAFWRHKIFSHIDWLLVGATVPLVLVGLATMSSFVGQSYFFGRQLAWIILAYLAFFTLGLVDWRFLRRSGTIASLFIFGLIILCLLLVVGHISRGAQSWFNIAGIGLQPADFMKVVLVMVLAKYFSRRHVEIAHIRHIIVSGLYALLPFMLILLQPDFGSALIIFAIWLGMIIVSGVSKKHLLAVFLIGTVAFGIMWLFVFAPYQKDRIKTFIHPLADIQGAGYNAYQSTIAVGSGEMIGKGVGYGTQSRLKFLPEYQTDFIFAAFAEEWGFIGVLILFFLFGVIIWRIILTSMQGASNFETLFGLGVAIILMTHFVIHVGMNIGLLPVTGLPMPFMSYGGSHLLTEFIALGILMGMRKYKLSYHREDVKNEFIGPQ
jgi:rod shape determining protein RodA